MAERCKNMESIIDFVTTGDVSDMSDLSDYGSEDEVQQIQAEVEFPEEDSDLDDDSDGDIPLAQLAAENFIMDNTNKDSDGVAKVHTYRWRKKEPPMRDTIFKGEFSQPPAVDQTPMDYFDLFFTNEIISMIVDQTNLYSTQKHGKCVNTNANEMRRFFGMHLLMGIVKLPAYTLYWSNNVRYPPVADVMLLKRFESLKRSIHVVDNTIFDKDSDDKLFKIRPLLEAVRNECIKVKPEEYQSVDEQIIPSKTRRTKIRQYNPKKPKKWGFKNLVRAGASGFMYDFFLYAGKDEPDPQANIQICAQVVSKLCKDLPGHLNHKVFFDNWFTTLDLMMHLKQQSLHAVGTIRQNRVKNCPLKPSKDLEKEGRGSLDYRTDNNSGIIITKWVDNKTIMLCSNYVGAEPLGSVKRWRKQEKSRVDVNCPQIVIAYNKSMGGVDLADMLIALYRIPIKTQRWYIKVFWHLVDKAKVNSWILYRRHCDQKGIPKKSRMTLLKFTTNLAQETMHSKQSLTPSRGRPTNRLLQATGEVAKQNKRGKAPSQVNPSQGVRYDRFLPDRNCFNDYHTK